MSDDPETARYKIAADRGEAWAQSNLGLLYARGRGGLPKDDYAAARYFKLAADQGHAPAQYNLAGFYRWGGGGLPRDTGEAIRLYKLARDQGVEEARVALRQMRGLLWHAFAEIGDGLRSRREQTEPARHKEANTQRERQARFDEEQVRQQNAAEEEHQRYQREQHGHRKSDGPADGGAKERTGSQRGDASGDINIAQALEILGLSAGANEQEVRLAYSRLMKRFHPDAGGSAYFSKQLNAARDVLLHRKRCET